MQIQISNTILYCARWKETVDFYKAGIGLRVTMERDWFVEFELTGTSRLSVANEAHATVPSGGGKGLTISLKVDDIKETHAFLVQAGLRPPAIGVHPWGAWTVMLHDPEGNRIEFWALKG